MHRNASWSMRKVNRDPFRYSPNRRRLIPMQGIQNDLCNMPFHLCLSIFSNIQLTFLVGLVRNEAERIGLPFCRHLCPTNMDCSVSVRPEEVMTTASTEVKIVLELFLLCRVRRNGMVHLSLPSYYAGPPVVQNSERTSGELYITWKMISVLSRFWAALIHGPNLLLCPKSLFSQL